VVIDDFDFVGISGPPSKADPILRVDSDTVLAASVRVHALEAISRGNRQFGKVSNPIYLAEFPAGYRPQTSWASASGGRAINSVKDVL
jgi:hypothetical protein